MLGSFKVPATGDVVEIKSVVNDRGLTVIMVSHDPEQAVRMGGETLLMVSGRLVESGISESVVNDPQTEPGRRYKNREL